jgi:hypothetical protein
VIKKTRKGVFVDVIVIYDGVKHLKGHKLENMKNKKHHNTRRGLNSTI